MTRQQHEVIGWDIGGAHVKACLMQHGEVVDVAQWACPLWQGMDQLVTALDAAAARWPGLGAAQHAVTMTGEMVDLFANREDGVRRIAEALVQSLGRSLPRSSARSLNPPSVAFYAGDAGWCSADDVSTQWESIASANWLATAGHAAQHFDQGVLVDIGSTTTDIIAFRNERVLTRSRTDAQRLAGGELVYHGVVRTPLCAVAKQVDWRGTPHNVMNEFFATAADVYRATGELNPAHDLYPSADNAAKHLAATHQRLARMVGLDERDGSADDWLAFARSWRAAQVAVLGDELRRVIAAHGLGPQAVVVSAGCGDFLVRDVLAHAVGGAPSASPSSVPSSVHRLVAYGTEVARVAVNIQAGQATVQGWAQVCAPCIAVATLFDMEHR